MASARLIVCGILVAVFASQLAAFNNWLINVMPDGMRSFYQKTASMGYSRNSAFWISYNRYGGLAVATLGVAVMIAGRFIK